MIGFLILATAAKLAPPPTALIDRIEAQALRQHPCVRPLGQWQRSYSYDARISSRGFVYNQNLVRIVMVEAGHNGARAGRTVTAEPSPPTVDDSQFRLVSAHYDIAKRRFTDWYCGSNWPSRRGATR
jgi:hypothetical protein